jgi:hypothetical protein
MTKSKESQEFKERKELISLQRESDHQKFKEKMEILSYERETDRLRHERDLERGRIRNAEIKKNLMLKERVNRYEK